MIVGEMDGMRVIRCSSKWSVVLCRFNDIKWTWTRDLSDCGRYRRCSRFNYTSGAYAGENSYKVYDQNNVLLFEEGAGTSTPNSVSGVCMSSQTYNVTLKVNTASIYNKQLLVQMVCTLVEEF